MYNLYIYIYIIDIVDGARIPDNILATRPYSVNLAFVRNRKSFTTLKIWSSKEFPRDENGSFQL